MTLPMHPTRLILEDLVCTQLIKPSSYPTHCQMVPHIQSRIINLNHSIHRIRVPPASQYPCTSVFSLLFLSFPYLWSRLPPPPPSVPLFPHRPSSVQLPVVFHRDDGPSPSQALLTLERPCFLPSFIVVCQGRHASVCVCVQWSFIAFQAYFSVHSPLLPSKGQNATQFLQDALKLQYLEDLSPHFLFF